MLLSLKTLVVGAALFVLPLQAQWTAMTSGDLEKTGTDSDGIWYVKEAVERYNKAVPEEKRQGLFWAGGATTQEDFDIIAEFQESETRLDEKAVQFLDVFSFERDFGKGGMNLDPNNRNNLWWRALNRISKALAAAATNEDAWVYLKPTGCRTLFSPPSTSPRDADPTRGGVATNGEIFYYAELPMLMRNTNIKRIHTFSKVGSGNRFTTKLEWDVDRDLDKPRDFLPDIAMDAVPIVLPDEAGRPPMKRDSVVDGGEF